MADADRDKMLRAMAENRGCKLVKSRRRTPGAGDYGRYGLKDGSTGKEVFGFAEGGLTATPEAVEEYLRRSLASTWKESLTEAPAAEPEAKRRKAAPEPKAPPEPPKPKRPAKPSPPPAPAKPKLVVRDAMPRDSAALARLVTELGFATEESELATRLARARKSGEPPLVAGEDDEVIGCLTWHVTPALHRPRPVGRITMLVVANGAQRRGVGTALVAAAEEKLRARGCGLVEATSNIELGGAHQFYKRRGFERTSYRFARPVAREE